MIFILRDGRKPFLEYLRNVSSQVPLVALAWLLGVQLDFHRVDFSNWAMTGAFIFTLLALAAAFVANLTLFVDASFDSLEVHPEVASLIRGGDSGGSNKVRAVLAALWRQHRSLFFDLVVTVGLTVLGLFSTLYGGTIAGLSAMRTLFSGH